MGGGPVAPLLLDTHVWLWLVNGEPLHHAATVAIRRASADSGLCICAISLWEVAMLEAKGRIQLQMDCLEWVAEACRRTAIRVVPLSAEIAVASTRLPGELHGDPADRLIAATARHEGAILVTRDHSLLAYARRGYLHAIEA